MKNRNQRKNVKHVDEKEKEKEKEKERIDENDVVTGKDESESNDKKKIREGVSEKEVKETLNEDMIREERDKEKEKRKEKENEKDDSSRDDNRENQKAKKDGSSSRIGEDPSVKRNREEQTEIPVDGKPLVEDEETAKGGFQLMLDSILSNLKIVIAGSKELDAGRFGELENIDFAECEMPAVIDKMPPEVEFIEDPEGEWCLCKARIRRAEADWQDYESFLKTYRHIVEKGVKEMYRFFKINETTYELQQQIMRPDYIGFASDPREAQNPRCKNIVYDNVPTFSPLRAPHARNVPIVLNPVLSGLTLETQRFLIEGDDAVEALREWIALFIRKKDQFMQYGLHIVYGRNNAIWVRVPHPRRVGLFLNLFPNANRISIPFALKFIGPRVMTRSVNVKAATAALMLSVTSSTILSQLATDPLSTENKTDIENIIKALILPGQIQLEIEYDINDPQDLLAVAALTAKVLLNVSPLTRNITRMSAEASDRVIASWLTLNGYSASEAIDRPLSVRRRRGAISVFDALSTNFETGDGWSGARVPQHVRIEQPLYDGIALMPQLAGVPPSRTPIDYTNLGSVASPPIMNDVLNALNEGSNENTKCIAPLTRWFRNQQPSYMQFAGSLNQYLMTFGETGFRLSDRRMAEMMMANNAADGLNAAANEPVIIPIRYDSLYKFFRALPERVDPPTQLAKQINAESLVSAELQRVISAFLIMMDRLEFDARADGYVPRQIFKWAVEDTKSNHFAKKILEICLADGDAARVSIQVLRASRAHFDEFEAMFFPEYATIVCRYPESFGITMDVVKRRIDLPALSENEYMIRTREGIILDNALNPLLFPLHRLTWDEYNARLRSFSMITELRRADVLNMIPLPMKYDEETVTELKDDNPSPITVLNVNSDDVHLVDREKIEINTFRRKFLLPRRRQVFRPDQIFYGSDFLQFWTLSQRCLTRTLDEVDLIGEWMHTRVTSWRGYVEFKNPLALRAAGDEAD